MSYQHYILIEEAYSDDHNGPASYPTGSQLRRCSHASRLTDVTDFFHDLIEAYLKLEQMAHAIIDKVAHATPEELLLDSKALCQFKRDLSEKDEQLISIIGLAGRELANTPLIHDYRVAFAKATMSSNNLYQRLKALQFEILEEALQEFI